MINFAAVLLCLFTFIVHRKIFKNLPRTTTALTTQLIGNFSCLFLKIPNKSFLHYFKFPNSSVVLHFINQKQTSDDEDVAVCDEIVTPKCR